MRSSAAASPVEGGAFAALPRRRESGLTQRNKNGFNVMETTAVTTNMSVARSGKTFNCRPRLARMNENSPIWLSATATITAVETA